MNIGFVIPLFIGASTILQAALNKQMSGQIGLVHSTLIGASLFMVFGITLYLLAQYSPDSFPAFYHIKTNLSSFKWWYIFPAIFGFCIVAGLPYAYFKIGAVKVTVLMIAAQMMTSILWDLIVEKSPLQSSKMLGLFFGALSVFFTLAK